MVRSALFGPDTPVFSGTVAYRGLLPAAKVGRLQIPNTSTKWWGPARNTISCTITWLAAIW